MFEVVVQAFLDKLTGFQLKKYLISGEVSKTVAAMPVDESLEPESNELSSPTTSTSQAKGSADYRNE